MKKLFLVPVFVCAACGDNLQPTDDQTALGSEDESAATPATPDKTLVAGFIFEPSDCADHSVRLEGHFGYTDGSQVDNPICRYDFGDGTFSDSCFAVHPFPTTQLVTFTVTDPATGAVATDSDGVSGPLSWSATLDVSTDGLTISWDAHTLYGVAADVGNVHLSFDPSDKVIVDDPSVLGQLSGTVRVTEAGTYTVHLNAGISFADVGGCGVFVDKTIEVVCNGDHVQ